MFSVVIPLYNKHLSIQNTLNCVVNQTFQNFEILIIDDGSTDNSCEIVQSNKLTDSRVRLIKKKNGGVSSARNEGIKCSTMNYIAFLDSDDFWEINYLDEQAKLIHEFPKAGLWGCALGIIEKNKKSKGNQGEVPEGFRGLVQDYFGRKSKANIFSASSVVVDKSVFKTVGLFDERISFGEDLDMWFRIALSFPVVFYNIPLAYYNLDAENRAMELEKPDLTKCLPYYIDKYKSIKNKPAAFYHYFHSFCAGYIQPYYFGNSKERILSQHVVNELDYSKTNSKYKLFYKSPYLLGLLFYSLFILKNHIRKLIKTE